MENTDVLNLNLSKLENMDSKITNIDAKVTAIKSNIKDIVIKLNNIEDAIDYAINDTSEVIEYIHCKIDNLHLDKLTLFTLEETIARLKKENYIIKKHIGLE